MNSKSNFYPPDNAPEHTINATRIVDWLVLPFCISEKLFLKRELLEECVEAKIEKDVAAKNQERIIRVKKVDDDCGDLELINLCCKFPIFINLLDNNCCVIDCIKKDLVFTIQHIAINLPFPLGEQNIFTKLLSYDIESCLAGQQLLIDINLLYEIEIKDKVSLNVAGEPSLPRNTISVPSRTLQYTPPPSSLQLHHCQKEECCPDPVCPAMRSEDSICGECVLNENRPSCIFWEAVDLNPLPWGSISVVITTGGESSYLIINDKIKVKLTKQQAVCRTVKNLFKLEIVWKGGTATNCRFCLSLHYLV